MERVFQNEKNKGEFEMRKTELTEEQQKKFKWLMDADTKNEDVEVSEFGYLIWKGGVWEDGTWEYGNWKGGYWEDGTWEGGTWEGGTWKGGTWIGGLMWSNLKHKYIHVKWDEDKKEFKEDLK